MPYTLISLFVHILCFIISFWALSNVAFERFVHAEKPGKTQMLLLLLALALGYLVAQFLLNISIFAGV